MTREEMIDLIIEGFISDICNWVARDLDSLDMWLRGRLELEKETKEGLEDEYGMYLPDPELEEEIITCSSCAHFVPARSHGHYAPGKCVVALIQEEDVKEGLLLAYKTVFEDNTACPEAYKEKEW